jgi:hypothetical protein
MGDTRTQGRRALAAAWLAVLLAGCGGGGSGSTGLITSEGSVVDDVRSGGTCEEFDGTPYCGTDSPNAVAPGGQSVRVVGTAVPTPVRTPTPPALSATPAPAATPTGGAGAPTATPGAPGTASPAPPTPQTSPSPADGTTVRLRVEGFDVGAACATAARAAGSDDPWTTAGLVALDPPDAIHAFPVPSAVDPPRDLALLCFEAPPAELASEVATLADAGPTVVFVLP